MTTPKRLVMKFGGTSVADMARIRRAADHVERELRGGGAIAVVVSARAGETDALLTLTREADGGLYDNEAEAERDAVIASGEQVTAGLLALVLQARGFRARSWSGPTAPLRTDGRHGAALIVGAQIEALAADLDQGVVAVVAGFQGLEPGGRIATIGRGGSDATATALAAALKAAHCDIYTDVDGVYTADPRIVQSARKIDEISFEEMLEMAALGAKVLQARAVEIAMRYNVPIRVLSSLDPQDATGGGTWVREGGGHMETRTVSGVTHTLNTARIIVLNVRDEPGVSAALFEALSDVNVDIIVQSASRVERRANMTITVPRTDLARAVEAIEAAKAAIDHERVIADPNVAKVSIVGVGMASQSGVAQTMFRALADKGINIHAVSTSEIKISVLIDSEYMELAVRALHGAFGLGAAPLAAAR